MKGDRQGSWQGRAGNVSATGSDRLVRRGLGAHPKHKYPEVVILIDNAPWHSGAAMKQVLADNPHLKLKRLPSYSPQLNPIERFWKKLRRRATHNRLFDSLGDLKQSLLTSLCYFQTVRKKVKSMLAPRQRAKAK
jgi:transposase